MDRRRDGVDGCVEAGGGGQVGFLVRVGFSLSVGGASFGGGSAVDGGGGALGEELVVVRRAVVVVVQDQEYGRCVRAF